MTPLEIVLSIVLGFLVPGMLWISWQVSTMRAQVIGNGKRGLAGDVASARSRLTKVEKEQAVHLAIADTGSSGDDNAHDMRLAKRFADFLAVERRRQRETKTA